MHRTLFPSCRQAAWQTAIFALVTALFLTASARAQTNKHEFPTLHWPVYPLALVNGPGNSLWFTEYQGSVIGQFAVNSNNTVFTTNITEYSLYNNSGAEPYSMMYGPGNFLWFTDPNLNAIGRIVPGTSNYLELRLTNDVNRVPADIALGADGNVWFLEYGPNQLAAVSGSFTSNSSGFLPIAKQSQVIANNISQLAGLCSGPDGKLWFCELSYGKIGRYDPLNSNTNVNLAEFTLPNTNCQPRSITTGPDGALWFTEYNTNRIGRITTNGAISEYIVPIYSGYTGPSPFYIAAGPASDVWFTEINGSAAGRVSPGGIVSVYPTLTVNSLPLGICTGPDGNVYCTEYSSDGTTTFPDQIAEFIVNQLLLLSAPTTYSAPGLGFSGPLGTFANSCPTNSAVINWGDGTSSYLSITNAWGATNSSVTTNPVVKIGAQYYTNFLTITRLSNVVTNVSNGSFAFSASHNFPAVSNYSGNITISDAQNNISSVAAMFSSSSIGINASGPNFIVYWTTNAAPLALYQNTNLLTTNWARVTNAVTLSNGLNQVALPRTTTGNSFFRLQ